MALTQEQIINVCISTFDAAPGAANLASLEAWAATNPTATTIDLADSLGALPEFAAQFTGMDATAKAEAMASHFGLSSGTTGGDAAIAYFEDQIAAGTSDATMLGTANDFLLNTSPADLATLGLTDAAANLVNKTTVATYYSVTAAQSGDTIADLQAIVDSVDATTASVTAAEANIDALGQSFTLTNGTDIATSGTFTAPMVYTPNGSDRILSLQDEDQLTGLGDHATLNATLGNRNADEGTTATVTPVLKNITTLNIDWTGNTNVLDLRYADSVKNINIDKITSDVGVAVVQNITTKASDLSISNVHDNTSAVIFDYVRDVLSGGADEANLSLDNVLANALIVQTDGGALTEGYENVNLSVKDGVDIRALFSVAQMENLVVTGDGYLDILNLVPTANEYNAFATAITNPGSIGQRTIDLSGFSGTSDIDISLNLGKQVDPGNSGKAFYGVTTGGSGDDTFRTNVGIAGNDKVDHAHNIIDGGAGNNTLVSYNGTIANDAAITNIQTLELRDQTVGFGAVDMDAFDSALASIEMRDEDAGVTTFTLNDMTATQAENAMTLHHGISLAGAPIVIANLKDASGADDTVALTVVNDRNTGTTFNYTLTAGGTTAATTVENITLHDNDTESNIVTLTNNAVHTGTLTLDGGTAGNTYTLANTIDSAVVDASAQASDLRLTVGDVVAPITTITQDVRLGTGDDVLTFANIDELDSTDSLSDAGGVDTVRAAFSKDSNLSINGIENLQVTATANVKLGMGNANIQNLVLLSNTAVDNTGGVADLDANGVTEPFGILSSAPTSIITLDHSALTELNYFADNDANDANNILKTDDVKFHTFNGVTLDNNTATDVTVNINSSLDTVFEGSLSYTLGQITSHGNTGMNIVVGDEDQETVIDGFTTRTAGLGTTINNIYAKTMETLTASAYGNLNLGTVSGAPLNNSLKTFDMSKVGGSVTANIISLGDNATVTLADGNNVVSALGSAGKDVTMTAGNGNNTLQGTAQDDTITTGSGWDIIAGDRGDNVITAGAGNDIVTAKDGSDTVDLGTGIDTFTDNVGTGISAATATNTVSMSGGIATANISATGGTLAAATHQMLAVGDGSDLTVSWTGGTMNATTAVLDGALAIVTAGSAATTATASADLNIITTGGISTVVASAGNDVTIFTGSVAGTDGLTFNGGAGNDAAVGTASVDNFTGGTGADKFVMQDTSTIDANSDRVIVADGDSTASAYDTVFGWDVGSAAAVAAAVVGAATAGSDVLDLDSTTIAGLANNTALTSNITTASGTIVDGVTFSAAGSVTFDDNSIVGPGGVAVGVGTAANDISLSDALTALATELNGTGATAVFTYDANGDGAITAADSTFVFQDGVHDTVVELAGVFTATGLENVAGGADTLINIA